MSAFLTLASIYHKKYPLRPMAHYLLLSVIEFVCFFFKLRLCAVSHEVRMLV